MTSSPEATEQDATPLWMPVIPLAAPATGNLEPPTNTSLLIAGGITAACGILLVVASAVMLGGRGHTPTQEAP